MHWLDLVGRDPVPWLLDPANPSARYQTLKHIFRLPQEDLDAEQQRILDWKPVATLRRNWDPINHWGRAENPYYGGPVGNFGTLILLAQLGVPCIPEVEAACENLILHGKREDGLFAPEGAGAAPWLSYSGLALHSLEHFGLGDDPRVLSAWDVLLRVIKEDPQGLNYRLTDRSTRAGAVKALRALIHRDEDQMSPQKKEVIEILVRYLLAHTYKWEGEDADWLLPRFPRYYDSDIVEFCHVLAHTDSRNRSVVQQATQRLLELQDEGGRWPKMKSTPAFSEERIFRPSRWLTFEAVHALMLLYGDEIYAP
ncbi:MAG: hypothetical protein ACP5HS_00815 [Anaerolineae bacterium]